MVVSNWTVILSRMTYSVENVFRNFSTKAIFCFTLQVTGITVDGILRNDELHLKCARGETYVYMPQSF